VKKSSFISSHSYKIPLKDNDYNVIVILKDGAKKPIFVLQSIYGGWAQNPNYKNVDILANYRNRFEARSKLPTIEYRTANDLVAL